MVGEDGNIVRVLDWESAAFYPRFWLGTKPLVSAGFLLPGIGEERKAWAKLLTSTLENKGLHRIWRDMRHGRGELVGNIIIDELNKNHDYFKTK